MGYTTNFTGHLNFNKKPTNALKEYINNFSKSRRMKRDINKIKELDANWQNNCFKGKLGIEGDYYIGKDENSVVDINCPPGNQPGLWCDWIINDDDKLVWNGVEKFYNYKEWLEYLIFHFLERDGYILNGEIEFQGEYEEDHGFIVVKDNYVEIKMDYIII